MVRTWPTKIRIFTIGFTYLIMVIDLNSKTLATSFLMEDWIGNDTNLVIIK